MLSGLARSLLHAMGKECTARGVLTGTEIPVAQQRLQDMLATASDSTAPDVASPGDELPPTLAARAWPMIEMLKGTRSAHGEEAYIMWHAAANF